MYNINWDNYQPVEGYEYLYRDKTSGAIINMDFEGFNETRKRHADALKKIEEQNALINKIKMLEDDMQDIKTLLSQISRKL